MMLDWPQLYLFLSVALIMVFVPGPNTLYIIARSVEQGRIAGITSSLGVQVGTMVHIAASSLGLTALLLTSAYAFNIVKYGGAAYLIFLGVKTLLTKENAGAGLKLQSAGLRRIFYQGALVNVLNPKTALFFLAFLPQFVDAGQGAVSMQIAFFGLILIILGTISDTIYALAAGSIGNKLRDNFVVLRVQRYFAGIVYLGLGTMTAVTGFQRR